MSFSLIANGTKDELLDKLNESFNRSYPDPAPGVLELVTAGIETVSDFVDAVSDDGKFSVSISGHAKQPDSGVRDNLAISINPVA